MNKNYEVLSLPYSYTLYYMYHLLNGHHNTKEVCATILFLSPASIQYF